MNGSVMTSGQIDDRYAEYGGSFSETDWSTTLSNVEIFPALARPLSTWMSIPPSGLYVMLTIPANDRRSFCSAAS